MLRFFPFLLLITNRFRQLRNVPLWIEYVDVLLVFGEFQKEKAIRVPTFGQNYRIEAKLIASVKRTGDTFYVYTGILIGTLLGRDESPFIKSLSVRLCTSLLSRNSKSPLTLRARPYLNTPRCLIHGIRPNTVLSNDKWIGNKSSSKTYFVFIRLTYDAVKFDPFCFASTVSMSVVTHRCQRNENV